MSTTYDEYQTTFYFSLLSNAAGAKIYEASSLAQATEAMTSDIAIACQAGVDNTALIGPGWTIAWGPAVYCSGPKAPNQYTPTNAAVVFYNNQSASGTGRYVAAIAATNIDSIVDWLSQDFDVITQVPWSTAMANWSGKAYTGTSTANLSQGTYTGISSLLNNLVGANHLATPVACQSLISFLNSVTPNSTDTLVFTGHSLGGALAPTLAAACFDSANSPSTNGLLSSAWKVANALVYPTAGATPGDEAFATQFASMFSSGTPGANPWQCWNTVLWNGLDVVPHAWQSNTNPKDLNASAPYLQQIPTEYAYCYPVDAPTAIYACIKIAADFSNVGGKTNPYMPLRNAPMQPAANLDAGFFYSYTVGDQVEIMTKAQAQTLGVTASPVQIAWDDQFAYQHVQAYSQIILGTDIPIVVPSGS